MSVAEAFWIAQSSLIECERSVARLLNKANQARIHGQSEVATAKVAKTGPVLISCERDDVGPKGGTAAIRKRLD